MPPAFGLGMGLAQELRRWMRVIAFITEPRVIHTILRRLEAK